MNFEYQEIGARITSRRKELGMTLTDLADEVGVAASTIYRYEQGSFSKIKIPVIESIAIALRVSPGWLLGNTDDPIDYEDPELIASISTDLLKHFNYNVPLAYAASVARTEHDDTIEIKEEPDITMDDELLDAKLIRRLVELTPSELEKVDSFVQGLLAAREGAASPRG